MDEGVEKNSLENLKKYIRQISVRSGENAFRNEQFFEESMNILDDVIKTPYQVSVTPIYLSDRMKCEDFKQSCCGGDDEEMKNICEIIEKNSKMSGLRMETLRMFYHIQEDKARQVRNNDIELFFNGYVFCVFFNWIENMLLYHSQLNIFKQSNFEEFFSFSKNIFKSEVMFDGQKFSINEFFSTFRPFAEFISETTKNPKVHPYERGPRILHEFYKLCKVNTGDPQKSSSYLDTLIATSNLLVICYLKSLIKENKDGVAYLFQRVQVNTTYQLSEFLMSVYGLTSNANIQLLQLLSNVLNIQLSYYNLDEITPNKIVSFPFSKAESYSIPLIKINLFHKKPYYYIIYDNKFESKLVTQIPKKIEDEIEKKQKRREGSVKNIIDEEAIKGKLCNYT
jgi:hypothetical protein